MKMLLKEIRDVIFELISYLAICCIAILVVTACGWLLYQYTTAWQYEIKGDSLCTSTICE